MRTLRVFVRAVLAGLMFLYFGAGSLVLSWVVLPFMTRGTKRDPATVRRAHELVSKGFDQFHWLATRLGLIHFEPKAIATTLPAGPCVLVANHPTLVDVTAILAVVRSACIVVKHDLYAGRVMGPLLRSAWHIDAGGDGELPAAAVVDGAVERIRAGFSVLIFPEGTRSPANGLRRFQRGAFEIALRANVPIVPIVLRCDPPMLMKGMPWYALPKRLARLSMKFLEPIDVHPESEDRRQLAARIEALYQRQFSTFDASSHDRT